MNRLLRSTFIIAIMATASVSQSFAQTNFSVTNGDWTVNGNWDNGVPTAATETRVGTTMGGGVTPATATLSDHQNGATLNLTIGRDNGDVGEVDLINHANLDVHSVLQIGYNAGSTGSLILNNNSTLNVFGAGSNINVGNDGTGTLEVHDSAIIGDTNNPNDIRVGRNTGSFGTFLIDGGTVNTNNYVSVGGLDSGAGGQGTLRIKSGGTLNAGGDLIVWGPNNGPGTRSFLRIDASANLSINDANFNGGGLQLDDGADFNPTINGSVSLNNPAGPDNNGMHVLVTDSNTGTIDAELDGNGHLVKEGSGILILNNINNTYSGGTQINAGTLQVGNPSTGPGNSVFGNGSVNLNNDATLQTTPGQGYTVVVHGDFNANGSAPDAATFVVNLGGMAPFVPQNASDFWPVFGSVNLTTGTGLFAHRLPGSFFVPNDQITFLRAAIGSVNGTFFQQDGDLIPNDFGTLIQPFAHYVNGPAGEVDAVFGFAATFQSQAHTPNQIATAAALDAALAAGCIVPATNVLGNVPLGPAFRADLDLIAPEELAAIYETSFSSATVQTQNLQRRMNDIRDGSFGFCADGFAIRDEHGMAKDAKGGKDVVEQVVPPSDRWGVFITGTGDLVRTSGTYNADGYQLNQGGFTIGADYRVTHNFAIGIDGGFTETRGDLNNNGRLDVDSGKIGLYATFFTDGGFYVDGTASGGWNNYGTRRSAYLGQEHGATDGAEFDGSIAAGYDWKRGCWKFGPIASFEYDYAQFNSFTESDSSLIPLHFPDQNQDAERSNVGLHISHQQNYKGNGCNVISEVRAYWRHDYGDNAYAIDSNFVGCDDVFTVHGPEMGRDSALIDAGLTIMCTRHLSAYFYYDGQYGRDNYYVNAVSGGLRLQF